LQVAVTGATGLVGSAVVAELRSRGASVTVLSRDPARAGAQLRVQAVGWNPEREPAPAAALAGCDGVVHLAGENIAQRWTAKAKRSIRGSRVVGTRHLLEGLRALGKRPRVLVSASAIGYYGAHGEEPLDEESPVGSDFLARVCAAWEAEAHVAQELGVRVVQVRTGIVLDRNGGALAKMLPPFRLGLGGPVAGGRQYVSWVHLEDLVGMVLEALQDDAWSGPINATAPEPVTNAELSRVLARALHRPSLLPVPGIALRLLYGEMAQIITTGARALPAKPLMLGYRFRHPQLGEALDSALA
jgi:uncharacterized protein (TIGR01777 family)